MDRLKISFVVTTDHASPTDAEDAAGGIRSVERAAMVIQEISDAGRAGCRLVDIVGRTGLSKTTAHRILSTLVNVGWLDQEEDTGTYYLGVRLIGFGITASDRHGLLDLPLGPRRWPPCARTRPSPRSPSASSTPAVGYRMPLGSCAGASSSWPGPRTTRPKKPWPANGTATTATTGSPTRSSYDSWSPNPGPRATRSSPD
ncbi:helix-turn-helix domain-containing protein [Pseudonocardia xinjiangensis]|uniref:helix-turn-helix domain-containing protein n=1 Tax=Pseudonocardia xinjiangensis TaxID=75289 RepID=UPI003D8F5B75